MRPLAAKVESLGYSEMRAAVLVSFGFLDKEIADLTGSTESGVRSLLHTVYSKLGLVHGNQRVRLTNTMRDWEDDQTDGGEREGRTGLYIAMRTHPARRRGCRI